MAESNVAAAITKVMLEKNKDGSPKYSKLERRDLAVWCVLHLNLPVTPEVKPIMADFLSMFDFPPGSTDAQNAAMVNEYFDKNPLNPDLVNALAGVGRKEMLSGDKGYKDRGEQLAALRQVGKADPLQAPEDKPKKKKPKVKSGLK